MSRHFWRACNRGAGFSFVELLVTIVIAGIAFAAMVPMFIETGKAVAGDKSRTVALNIAQDRIEKVRRLNFASLTYENLNVVDDGTSPFTTTQYETTASGDKLFNVACVVTDLPVSGTDTRVVSRKVAVTVSWDAPNPGGSVSTSTIVYRQFAGPQITDFNVAPYDAEKDWITSSDVTLTITVNPADVSSMEPVAVGTRTLVGYVQITISPVNGSAVIPTIIVPYNAAHASTFTANWLVPNGAGAGDGYYKFTAVAYTANKSPGNTWTFSKHVETGPPAPVNNLTGTGAAGTASLTWTASISADLDHYEVFRSTVDTSVSPAVVSTPVRIKGDPATQPKWKDTGLTDTGLTDHQTYRYTVVAFDQAGNRSDMDVSGVLVPGNVRYKDVYILTAAESAKPLPVTELKGDPSANFASLVWTESASPGVVGYQVFANGNTTTPVATVVTPYATVAQAWNTSAWYQVKPYTAGVNLSDSWASIFGGYPVQDVGGVQWVKVTTQLETRYNITIINDVSASNKKAGISLYYLGPTGTDIATLVGTQGAIKYGDPATWSDRAYGKYRWQWTTTDNPARSGQREESFTVGTGGTINVSRHCIAVP
jgi:type II secretory pathway pseudopilin PulG